MSKNVLKIVTLSMALFTSQLSAQTVKIPQLETARIKTMPNKNVCREASEEETRCRMSLKDAEAYCQSKNKHVPTVYEMALITTFFGSYGVHKPYTQLPYNIRLNRIVYSNYSDPQKVERFDYSHQGFNIVNEGAKVLMSPEEWNLYLKDLMVANLFGYDLQYSGYWTSSYDANAGFNLPWLFDPADANRNKLDGGIYQAEYVLGGRQFHFVMCVSN